MNRNDRSITGLVMVAHAMVHTYELSLPILLSVWAARFETMTLPALGTFPVTDFVLGVVLTVGYAPFGLGALPGGVLADAYGSRTLIAACLLGMGGSFLTLALAPSLPAIAACLFVWGVAASVYHPAGLALVSKGVSARGTAFAYHGIAGNVGIGFGPLATALLLLAAGEARWRLVVALVAVPALAAAALAARIEVDETAAVAGDGGDARATGSVSSLREFRSDSRRLFGGLFVVVFGVVMLSGLYYRGVLTFLPELLAAFPSLSPIKVAGRPFEPARYVYAGLLGVGVVGQYVGGKLTDRLPTELGLIGGFGALAALAVVFLPVATAGLLPLFAVCGLLGVFLFVVQPFYQVTVAEYTPAGARGLSYGYTYLGVFGIGALGGTIAGAVLTIAGPPALFGTLAGFATLAAVAGAVLYLRR